MRFGGVVWLCVFSVLFLVVCCGRMLLVNIEGGDPEFHLLAQQLGNYLFLLSYIDSLAEYVNVLVAEPIQLFLNRFRYLWRRL